MAARRGAPVAGVAPSPPALRVAALAWPPRLRAAALFRSGGPAPCGRPRPLPSPPVGGGRALPVAAVPAVVGRFWGRALLVGPRRGSPFRAPRPRRVPALRLGCAALALPRRVGLGRRAGPSGRPGSSAPGAWPLAAGGGWRGHGSAVPPQARSRSRSRPRSGQGQAAVRGSGGLRPPSPGCSRRSRPHDVLTIPKELILYLTSPFKRGILGIGRASPHGSLKFPPPCRNSTAVGTAFFFPTLCGAGGGVPTSPTSPRPSPIRARGAEEQAPSPYTIYPRAQQNLRLFC